MAVGKHAIFLNTSEDFSGKISLMERRGQARDMLGIQNSANYIPPQATQESPVKLPLAPLVATSADRRGNATVSTRRGSSIFSPTKILDHQNHPPPHLRHQATPPQQPPGQKEATPDTDPVPTAASTAAGSSTSKAPVTQPQASPPPPPPAATAAIVDASANCTNTSSIIYRECLKNHAANIGGHIVDGCGEFMASGEEGTPEALRCAACDCHRNFHRKEVKGEPPAPQQPYVYYPYNPNSSNNIHRPNPLLHNLQTPRGHQQNHQNTPPTMVNFGGNAGGGVAESSSEDLNMLHSGSGGHASMQPSISGSKKRFRTKFSQEQKDRMHEFAEKLEWRIQKQDYQEVQQFCSEVGVQRQVFKVWMHNNKQVMKKKQI